MVKRINEQFRIGQGGLKVVTANISLDNGDIIALVDATAGPITVTLFTAVGWGGKKVCVKKTDVTDNIVTIAAPSGQTIDERDSVELSGQFDSMLFISDNENYDILERKITSLDFANFRDAVWFRDNMMYNANPTDFYTTENFSSPQVGLVGTLVFVSLAVAGSRCHIAKWDGKNRWDSTLKLTGKWRYRFDLNPNNMREFVGFFSPALPTAAEPSVEPTEGIYFRKISAGSQANWFAVTRNGGSETAVDTGLIDPPSIMQDLEIRSTPSKVIFLIDGVVVATITTNIPQTFHIMACVTVTRNATTAGFEIGGIEIFNRR